MRLTLALLALTLSVSVTPARAQVAPSDSEIRVTGQRGKDANSVPHEVRQTLLIDDGQVARLSDPICLVIVGLPPAFVDAVRQRVQEIARLARIRVAKGKCEPNVVAIVSDNADAFANEANRLHPNTFAVLPDAERRRALQPGPVHVWSMVDTQNEEGTSVVFDPDGAAASGALQGMHVSTVRFPSHQSLTTDKVILRSIVVIDASVLRNKTVAQFADYVMMRGVAGAHPGDDMGADTILTLFEPGGTAHGWLTDFDLSFLKGLYKGSHGQRAADNIGMIAHQITKDRRAAAASEATPSATIPASPRPAPPA